MNRNKIILPLVLGLFFLIPSITKAAFNPNNIISDIEILDYESMNLEEIRTFLNSKNSYIANNYFTNPNNDKRMTGAEIIYEIATTNKINPKFLIVLLQKEQGLIEDKAPKQSQLDWATGYGCPDGGGCDSRWKGIYKQINSASLQFLWYLDGCQEKDSLTYNPYLNKCSYQPYETYTFKNPYSTIKQETTIVTPENKATCGLYIYTPHVYNGNFNFYKLWQKYFTRTYPNGSLLQAEGEPGVWLVQNGQKRPFTTRGALTSRFDQNKIITVKSSDLDKYTTGSPIKFPQYSLVRSPRGTIFLLVDDKRRGFASGEAFRKIGFNPEEIMDASWDDINAYEEGIPITASSSYPTGALLQDRVSGGVYWVTEGTKAPLWDAVLLKTKYKGKSITQEDPEKLASYTTVEPAIFGDGELIKSDISPAVYVIDNGKKRPITSAKVFEELGYKWSNIIQVPAKISNLYEEGEVMTGTSDNEEESSEIEIAEEDASTASNTASTIEDDASKEISAELQEEIDSILNPLN